MEAAKKALENSAELFPQLDYQKRVMAHSMKRQKGPEYDADGKRPRSKDQPLSADIANANRSNLPKQYRPRGDDSDSSESESADDKMVDDKDSDNENGHDDDTETKTDADSEQTANDDDPSDVSIVRGEQSNHADSVVSDIDANRPAELNLSGPSTSSGSYKEDSVQPDDVHMASYYDSEASIESGEIV